MVSGHVFEGDSKGVSKGVYTCISVEWRRILEKCMAFSHIIHQQNTQDKVISELCLMGSGCNDRGTGVIISAGSGIILRQWKLKYIIPFA